MAVQHSLICRSFDHQMFRTSAVGKRALLVPSSFGPHLAHAHPQPATAQRALTQPRVTALSPGRSHTLQARAAPARPALLLLSSTTTTAAAASLSESSPPTAFARVLVGAVLALSTVYTLLSSPASGFAFTSAPSRSPSTDADSADSTSSSPTSSTDTLAISTLPVLRTPEQFDAFVVASNRAGYLAIVLFHAPWCAASQRMESELQRLSHLFIGRRIVFARVDCAIKQGVRPGVPLGQAPGRGFTLHRCDLTQLHRIHRTPTMRMYYNNACVDEIIGCRPVDFRQAASDMTFKYNL